MGESIEATVAAYLIGGRSRDATRASLIVALAEGQRLERDLASLAPVQREDVTALLKDAVNNLLQIRPVPGIIASGPATTRWPPFGYMLVAGLLAWDLVAEFGSVVIGFPYRGDPSQLAGLWSGQVLWALATIVEGFALWAVWAQRRAAPEIYAAWAGTVLVGSFYRLRATLGPAVGIASLFAIVVPALGFGLAYWYLARHRVPAV